MLRTSEDFLRLMNVHGDEAETGMVDQVFTYGCEFGKDLKVRSMRWRIY